jgi:hypothetical protein
LRLSIPDSVIDIERHKLNLQVTNKPKAS